MHSTARCPQCGATDTEPARHCRECGTPWPSTPTPHAAGAAEPHERGSRERMGIAVLALLLNLFILPGLGSVIAGRREGWWQMALALSGVILSAALFLMALFGVAPRVAIVAVFLGIPLVLTAWIWGIVTGVRLMREA